MTLQQRIKASAQELVRLLEESDKEHQDFLKERDARLKADPLSQNAARNEEAIEQIARETGKTIQEVTEDFYKDPSSPKADAQEECSTKKSYYITSLCKLFDKVSLSDTLDVLDTFTSIAKDGSFYFNK